MDQEKYSVVVADDHRGIRKGIIQIIESDPAFKVVAEAGDGTHAVAAVKKHHPDLLILDVMLPDMEGPEVARTITNQERSIKILALSTFDYPEFIQNMLANGAQGYVTKDEAPDLLHQAALEILRGDEQLWLSGELRGKLGENLVPSMETSPSYSKEEFKILDLLKQGKSENEIAGVLDYSQKRLSRYLKILAMKHNADSLEDLRMIINS